jgi:hypothetical protein
MSNLVAQTNSTSIVYEASRLVCGQPCRLFGFTGYNSKASAQFIQVLDASIIPATGAVPVITFTVPATSNFSWDDNPNGRLMAKGIIVVNSSTGPTYTAGSADCWFDVQFTL